MSARWRSPTGSAPGRVTSPASSPGRRTSWSTSSSRAPSGARPRPSPRSSTRSGGDCNAFTTKEYTTFYVRLLSEHLPLGLDILSDIMWAPALRPDDIEAERTVILDEILMHADEPADLAGERWQAALFPGHALGRDTLGTASSVQRITRDDIRAFFDLHYRPSNMVVSVAGDCTHEAVAADLQRRFAGTSGGAAPVRTPPGPGHGGPRRGAPVHRAGASDLRHALGVAVRRAALVAGRAEPRPGRRPVEPALPEGARAARAGLFGLVGALGLPGQRVAGRGGGHGARARRRGAARSSSAEFDLLAADGITERELAVAKGNLRAEMLLSGEDSGARMSRLGASMLLHGEVLSVDEVLRHIDGIERADVLEVAAELAQVAPHVERRRPLRRAGLRVPPGSTGSPVALQDHAEGRCGRCRRPHGPRGLPSRLGGTRPRAGGRHRPGPRRGRRVRPHHRGRGERAARTSGPRSWSTSPSPKRCATT